MKDQNIEAGDSAGLRNPLKVIKKVRAMHFEVTSEYIVLVFDVRM